MKRPPIRESNFRKLIGKDCYFVDKREFIPEILNENDKSFNPKTS